MEANQSRESVSLIIATMRKASEFAASEAPGFIARQECRNRPGRTDLPGRLHARPEIFLRLLTGNSPTSQIYSTWPLFLSTERRRVQAGISDAARNRASSPF